ncbi:MULTISPECIES: hypothetical protein [unclassified Microbacterium]|uniref:hypothetical protein n=1 Tax=unclassified Microbacterium TaxID=2609290 RepID=UPI00214B91B7|nr:MULTISPECIES: hypothetical protein [unclassified Microbacterium]MCR2808396.1 hypothetical protein [Microbacterium sp. zg.B185]WIM19158.1 hypothetical protein QNO12_16520 [Microbacterium sp. zg-B185]
MTTAATTTLDAAAATAVIEHLYEQGWSDGLPLVPATEPVVAEFLRHTDRAADEVVARSVPLGREATVRDVAIHSVMAGCRPEHFPVILAAWDALSGERAARGGGFQSTSGPSPLIVVNGPIRHELGINNAGGVLGPGFRPNATIPRAIGLTVRNTFGIRPQELDQSTQGVPGRWQVCVAEDEEESPWPPLSVECGLAPGESAVSATLLRTMEFVDNRSFKGPEDVLRDFADTIRRTGPWIFRHSAVGIIMNPEHADLFASAGMSKQDVRDWLFAACTRTEAELEAVGKGLSYLPEGPFEPDHAHHVLADATPASIPIVVAGSRNAAMSMVFRVFTTWSGQSFPVR